MWADNKKETGNHSSLEVTKDEEKRQLVSFPRRQTRETISLSKCFIEKYTKRQTWQKVSLLQVLCIHFASLQVFLPHSTVNSKDDSGKSKRQRRRTKNHSQEFLKNVTKKTRYKVSLVLKQNPRGILVQESLFCRLSISFLSWPIERNGCIKLLHERV